MKVMEAYYKCDKNGALEVNVFNTERIAMCNDFLKKCAETKSEKKTDILSQEKDPIYWTELSRIVENLKAMSSSIKYISRSVIDID